MSGRRAIMLCAALAGLAACSVAPPPVDVKAIEAEAHGGYLAAINSNDIAKFKAMVTDDVVYQAPNEPQIVGKDAVVKWGAGYFSAYQTHWEKTSLGFTVNGDWAFERYTYVATDKDRKTGIVTTDRGKGINTFRRGADSKWRVAVDGWSSDRP